MFTSIHVARVLAGRERDMLNGLCETKRPVWQFFSPDRHSFLPCCFSIVPGEPLKVIISAQKEGRYEPRSAYSKGCGNIVSLWYFES